MFDFAYFRLCIFWFYIFIQQLIYLFYKLVYFYWFTASAVHYYSGFNVFNSSKYVCFDYVCYISEIPCLCAVAVDGWGLVVSD